MPTYGQRPDDVVQDSRGNALRGQVVKFYATQSEAQAGGAPMGTATTDVRGRWSYTTAERELWARLSDGTVWQVANDPAELVAAAEAAASSAAATEAAVTAAYGFRPVVSETAPTETTVDGYPIIWLKPSGTLAEVPVLPTKPVWDNANLVFTVPDNITGAAYQWDGLDITPGVETPVPGPYPRQVTVEAVALPGYYLAGTFSWSYYFYDSSVQTVVASDTFARDGDIGNTNADNALGGSTVALWRPSNYALNPATNPIGLTGNALGAGLGGLGWASPGTYKGGIVDTGAANYHVELEVSQSPAGGYGLEFRVALARNGNLTQGGVGLSFFTPDNEAYDYVGSVGGTGSNGRAKQYAKGALPTGTYILEVFETNAKIIIPDGSIIEWTAPATSDAANRGSVCSFGFTVGNNTTAANERQAVVDSIAWSSIGA